MVFSTLTVDTLQLCFSSLKVDEVVHQRIVSCLVLLTRPVQIIAY